MFRILSLWLENRNNTEVVQLINSNLLKIPIYKFIPVLPQFVPHVTNNSEDSFGMKINTVIGKLQCNRKWFVRTGLLAKVFLHISGFIPLDYS